MKKMYTTLVLSMILLMFIGQTAIATTLSWKSHLANKQTEQTSEESSTEEDVAKIYIGHCGYDDTIWPSDGLSLDHDARVGVGIKLTNDMFKDYVGGKIVAIRAGWDDEESIALYDCFVRSGSFTGSDLATGRGQVRFGWNEINVKEPIELTNMESLYVGFYVDLKKDVCSIPFVYPYKHYDTTNCCYLYVEGDNTPEGKENWVNMSMTSTPMQPMAIVLVVEDTQGKFSNIIAFNSMSTDFIVPQDETGIGLFNISNGGTTEIRSLEVTTSYGESSVSNEVELSKAILQEETVKIHMPVHCFGSGEHTVTISKVNGEEAKSIYSQKVSLIGVPANVAENYTFRPVVQFFTSEDLYKHPVYFDEYFWEGFEPFKDEMTLICPHVDDKYQTGDNEALQELIDLCGGDLMKVYLPSTAINRTSYTADPIPSEGTPFQNGILLPDYVAPLYEAVLEMPTFASINIETSYDDKNQQATVDIFGNIAEGIMPEGEPLYLTVYLMEKDVESWDQMFWEEKEGDAPAPQLYIHKNIIREIITPYWGEELTKNEGKYKHSYIIDIDTESYKGENLYIAAFLNRGENNHHLQRQIINSNEASLSIPSGINKINSDYVNLAIETTGGQVLVNGQVGELYNLAGSRIINSNVTPGIYIVKAVVNGETFARKLVVK